MWKHTYQKKSRTEPKAWWHDVTEDEIRAIIFQDYVVTEPAIEALKEGRIVSTPEFHFRACTERA